MNTPPDVVWWAVCGLALPAMAVPSDPAVGFGKTPLPNVIAPSSLWFLPRNRDKSSEDACENGLWPIRELLNQFIRCQRFPFLKKINFQTRRRDWRGGNRNKDK